MVLSRTELFEFLEAKFRQYSTPDFIEADPISIPHLYHKKEDIEIAAFMAATIAWGQRKSIIANARKLMRMMDDAPHDFIRNANPAEFDRFACFYHRTFNGSDCIFFLRSLQNIYIHPGGLEQHFSITQPGNLKESLMRFREAFFTPSHLSRTEKHIANPSKGATAKRLLMFLRWMVRSSRDGVDFGLWKSIPASALLCPIDTHSGRVARKLGLLERSQNDWKAVEELTTMLRSFDPEDPVKYDYALFGLGVFEKF
jgi:uncharacterized protein (TIGR02757 family)